ncbi:DUF4255 domain-containing protein [Streptomyces sp. NPDC054765]
MLPPPPPPPCTDRGTAMIQLVDEALAARVCDNVPGLPSEAIDFQPPTHDRGMGETTGAEAVGIYLYDIREDLDRRQTGMVHGYAPDPAAPGGEKKVEAHDPPRYVRLSYLITAWAPDARIVHRMLGQLLIGFAQSRPFPIPLPGEQEDKALPALLDIGHPPAEDRALTELWSAVGHTLIPALNVTVTLPLPSFLAQEYTHWVHDDQEPVAVNVRPSRQPAPEPGKGSR